MHVSSPTNLLHFVYTHRVWGNQFSVNVSSQKGSLYSIDLNSLIFFILIWFWKTISVFCTYSIWHSLPYQTKLFTNQTTDICTHEKIFRLSFRLECSGNRRLHLSVIMKMVSSTIVARVVVQCLNNERGTLLELGNIPGTVYLPATCPDFCFNLS